MSESFSNSFEWDENKNRRNIETHGIDFVRAKEIWAGNVLELPSGQGQHSETRYMAIGKIGQDERIITVVFTFRSETIRIISARRARVNERKNYKNAFGRGS